MKTESCSHSPNDHALSLNIYTVVTQTSSDGSNEKEYTTNLTLLNNKSSALAHVHCTVNQHPSKHLKHII